MVKYLAIDTEAVGSDATNRHAEDTHVSHVSWWDDRGKGSSRITDIDIVHPSYKADPRTIYDAKVLKVIGDPKVVKLFWNAKYDLPLLKKAGIIVRGPILDVMLMARLVHTAERIGGYSLKDFARKYLRILYQEEINLKKWCSAAKKRGEKHAYGDAPYHILHPYSTLDAQATFELFWLMRQKMTPALWKLLHMEHKVLRATIGMENVGFKIDRELAEELNGRAVRILRKLKSKMAKLAGRADFNPNSDQQVGKWLFADAGRNPYRRTPKSGQAKVDKVSLLRLRDEAGASEAKLMLKWRKVDKARKPYLITFIEKTDDHSTLRGSFNQSGTRTGRFSSSGPNLQNITRPSNTIPGQLRNCIVAREGRRFICIDYNQVELRLGAHFAQVELMLRGIAAGIDLHGDTAKRMFGIDESHPTWKVKRQIAKTLNFAIFYGIGSEEFMETLIRESETYISLFEASLFRRRYHEIYPEIEEYFTEIAREVVQTGGVTNPFGRFMEVSKRKTYVGVNYKVQSTAADLIKERMVACDDLLRGRDTKLVATIHDELIFEMPAREKFLIPKLRATMEELEMFSVPLTCSVAIAKRLGQKKELAA